MLFQNLAALTAQGITVTMQIEQAENGQLEVSVIPTSNSGKSGVNLVPKVFVATPQELDAEFAEVIAGFCGVNLTLKQQLETMNSQAEDAAKAAQEAPKASRPAASTAPKTSTLPGKKLGAELNDDRDDDTPGSATAPGASDTTTANPMPFLL